MDSTTPHAGTASPQDSFLPPLPLRYERFLPKLVPVAKGGFFLRGAALLKLLPEKRTIKAGSNEDRPCGR